MGKTLFFHLLLTLGVVTAQEVNVKTIPNWLTGIIAVAVFLFLVFIAFIVNKAWCGDSSKEENVNPVTLTASNEYAMSNGLNIPLDSVRSHELKDAYENVIFHKSEETVTAM